MTLTRHGQDDSAERWRRDDDDSDNARHDSIPNTDTFAQTRGTIRLGNLAVASLTANEIITQLMHHRAHCVRGDGDQREEFYLRISLKGLLTISFQIANFTAVSISLPTLQKEMKLEPAQLQWMLAAYPLSSVS